MDDAKIRGLIIGDYLNTYFAFWGLVSNYFSARTPNEFKKVIKARIKPVASFTEQYGVRAEEVSNKELKEKIARLNELAKEFNKLIMNKSYLEKESVIEALKELTLKAGEVCGRIRKDIEKAWS